MDTLRKVGSRVWPVEGLDSATVPFNNVFNAKMSEEISKKYQPTSWPVEGLGEAYFLTKTLLRRRK